MSLKGVSQQFLTKMLVCALSSRWFFPVSVFRPSCWLTFAGSSSQNPKTTC